MNEATASHFLFGMHSNAQQMITMEVGEEEKSGEKNMHASAPSSGCEGMRSCFTFTYACKSYVKATVKQHTKKKTTSSNHLLWISMFVGVFESVSRHNSNNNNNGIKKRLHFSPSNPIPNCGCLSPRCRHHSRRHQHIAHCSFQMQTKLSFVHFKQINLRSFVI